MVSIEYDLAVRVARAHDPHMKLMRKGDVAGEAAAARDQRRVLQPRDRLADPFRGGRHCCHLRMLICASRRGTLQRAPGHGARRGRAGIRRR